MDTARGRVKIKSMKIGRQKIDRHVFNLKLDVIFENKNENFKFSLLSRHFKVDIFIQNFV